MSNKLTYIEARDKIWNAYFRDEIKPMDGKFCFCGTLNNNKDSWMHDSKRVPSDFVYSYPEFQIMEYALLTPLTEIGVFYDDGDGEGLCGSFGLEADIEQSPQYEETLFAGMLAALEVLKQIHRDRGDFIPEDEPLLTKRNLEHA